MPLPREIRSEHTLRLRDIVLGALGGIAGSYIGNFLFRVIAEQGYYALILPGAFTGLGCGILLRRSSFMMGIACALVGILAGILTEWRFAPFSADDSFTFFILHLHQLKPVTQCLILGGGFLAFWFGRGRAGGAPRKADGQ